MRRVTTMLKFGITFIGAHFVLVAGNKTRCQMDEVKNGYFIRRHQSTVLGSASFYHMGKSSA